MGVQKKVVSLLTASAMVLGSGAALPEEGLGSNLYITANAAAIVSSGTCGENVSWTLDDAGTLTISGAGKMENFKSYWNIPWYNNRDSVKKVIIKDGVTSIGSSAFEDCHGLTSITIPNGVTSIGSSAFEDCRGLTSITIPNGVTSIGSRAFEYCFGLTSITIPDSVTSIESSAFSGCSGLTSITIPNGVTSIESSVFSGCSGLTSITIPSSVTSIGNYAFYYCTDLTSVTIPSSVKSIGECAFYYCSDLTNVTIPKSVTEIGEKALGYYSYYGGDKKLDGFKINCYKGTAGEQYATDNDFEYELLDGAKIVESGKCGANVSWTLDEEETLTIRGTGAMTDYGYNDSPWYKKSSIKKVVIKNGVTNVGSYAFTYCTGLTSVTLSEGIKSIGSCALFNLPNIKSIKIPKSVTDIGEKAIGYYYDSSSLNQKKINGFKIYCYSGTAAEQYAKDNGFEYELLDDTATSGNCGENVSWSLDSEGTLTISIQEGVSGTGKMTNYTYGSSPWYYNKSIKNVVIKNGVTSIGKNAFTACSSLTSISIPESVTSIDTKAFLDCTELTNISVDSRNMEYLSYDGALYDRYGNRLLICPEGKTSIEFFRNLQFVSERALYNCKKLKSVDIPDGVTNIGESAFENCTGLESATISHDIFSIEKRAFYNCTKLKNLNINWISNIGESAFENCTSLESLTFPGCSFSIDERAFFGCKSLREVNLPDHPISIGDYAFCDCSSLKSIMLPMNVHVIGEYALGYHYVNSQLTKVEGFKIYCSERANDVQKYAKDNGLKYEISGDSWTLDDEGTLTIYEETGENFSDQSIKKVIIKDGVERIKDHQFEGCTGLTSVTIPDSVTSIEPSAFENCNSLTSVTIPKSVTEIYYRALGYTNGGKLDGFKIYCYKDTAGEKYAIDNGFEYELLDSANIVASGTCGENVSWTLDDSGTLTISGTGAMTNYFDQVSPWYNKKDFVKKVIIKNGVTSIGNDAFGCCSELTSITIPNSVTSIESGAFSGCSSLKSIDLPDSVTSIESSAFSGCSSLTSITIPNGVTSIGSGAFSGCSSLTSITIPNGVTSIDISMFSGCSSLTSITVGGKNLNYSSVDGVLYNKEQTELLKCPEKKTTVTIPNSVTSIGVDAFSCCSGLTSITIPNSVKRIGYCTFTGCSGLTSITIPNSVTSIGYCVFGNCSALTSITIPDSVTSIGSNAFENCSALTSITIPDSVTSIGNHAFLYCSELKSITVPKSVTNIGKNALGYYYDYSDYSFKKLDGFKITCYSGTAAEQYAIDNGFDYELLDKQTDISTCTITLSATSYTYDGTAKKPTVTVKDGSTTLKAGTDYTVTYPSDSTSAGSKTVTIKGINNYTGDVSKTYTISPKSISGATITASATSFTYDGTAKKPTITVKDGSATLKAGADYTVEYPSDSTNAGSKTITVKGINNYTGSVDKTYTINPKSISGAAITASATSFTYNGTAQKPTYTVKYGSVTLKNGTDYTVTYPADSTNAGTKTVTIKGIGNYTDSITSNYLIVEPEKKNISNCTITLSPTSYTYDGTAKKPTITVKDGSATLKAGTDYTVTYPSDSTNAGTKTITVKGINNYTGSVSKTYTISPKAISSATITLSATSFTYDGTEKKPTVTVKDGSTTLKSGTDYTVTYPSDSTNAGTKTITVKGINNYTGSVNKTYTINPKAISSTSIKANQTAFTYDGTEKKPVFTITDGSKTLASGTDYTVIYPEDCVSAGTKTITVKGMDNYTGSVSGEYEITAQLFVWGTDNWKFDNADYNFKWDYEINDKVKNLMREDFRLTDSDIYELEAAIEQNPEFNGSCFGMTISEILAAQKQLDLTRYGGVDVVNKNEPTSDMTSVINFIQLLQHSSNMLQVIRQAPFMVGQKTQADYVSTLGKAASLNEHLIKVGYSIMEETRKPNMGIIETKESKHAVLAYGIEDCKYKSPVTGLTYDKKILIADPNLLSGNKLNDDACIYYKSSDGSWIIPCRNEEISSTVSRKCYWNAGTAANNGKILNIYIYKDLTEAENLMADFHIDPKVHYVSGITINNVSGNESVVEQVEGTGNPNAEYGGVYSKKIARYDTEFADEMFISENEEMYALWNSTASYTLSYAKPSDFSLKMDFQSVDYYMDVTDVSYTLFKPSGYIAVKGSDADYSVTMVTDDSEKVNDWYALTAEGSGADSLELKKTKGGYVIKSNSLNKLKITAESSCVTAETIISTKYTAAFIYEIDKNTIGIKVDTDGNGTYETDITSVVPVITAEPGENSVKLSWSSVPNATKYAVCGLVNGKWTNLAEGTGTSYTLKDLVGGKDYRVAVVAMIGGKWTNDLSNAVTVTPDTPKPVLPVITAESDESTVKLTWTAVPGATRYAVCGRINGKWKKLAEGTGTAYTFKDLVSGKDYVVAVIAMKDGKWENDLSNAVTVRLAQPKPVYPIVTTIDYNEEYHQFKINWSAVPNAEQYGIAVKIGNKWKIQAYVSGKTTSFISPKLTPGKTYEMVVCAKVNGEWDTSKILNRAVKVTVK